jgi:hypothetical protein
MAFKHENLSVLSYANGFTLWHYRTTDLIADVDNVGYFNDAANVMRIGDFVFVNSGVGLVPTHGVLVVVSNANGVVDLSNVTPFGSINTD